MIHSLNIRSRLALLGAAATLFLGGPAHAAVLFYEGFDYTAGETLTGKGSWSGTINSRITITAPGSVYAGLPGTYQSSGNKATITAAGHTGGYIALGTTYGGQVADYGTSIYLSFLAANTSGGTAGYNYINFATGTALTPNPGFGTVAGTGNWGIQTPGTLQQAAISSADLALIVVKVDFVSATQTNYSMFVNPTSTTEPTTAYATYTYAGAASFDSLRMQSNQNGIFDEIRLGESFADVIPEPSSAMLGILGSSLMLIRKRRTA